MKLETARETANTLGWLVAGAAVGMAPLFVAGATLSGYGAGRILLAYSWASMALVLGAGIALIRHSIYGFALLYVAAVLGTILPGIRLLPLIHRIVPAGPYSDYYLMATNIFTVGLAIWCHWSLLRELEPTAVRRQKNLIFATLIFFSAGLVFWKTGIRVGKGEATRVAELPLMGPLLSPLESKEPMPFISHEMPRQNAGTLIFRGLSNEANVREFAEKHSLKLMTNVEARVKFLPLVQTWKLDPKEFPVFNQESDLCYIGRIPTNSALVFQICHRPADGRFTAMAMGSPKPREKR